MKQKKYLQKKVKKLVELSFKDGKLVESQVVRAIKLLKSLPSYQAISAMSEYLTGIKAEERKHTLYIETVIPLTSGQIKSARKIIEKKIKITKVLVNIKPEILGGFRLKIGDEIWDESVVGKIKQVKEMIIEGQIKH